MTKPAEYWRDQIGVREWLGKTGAVIGSTTIRASSPEYNYLTPYDFAVVNFGGVKKEFMAVAGETLNPGDLVKLVLRKLSQPDQHGLIEYGLKLEKVKE